MLKTRELKRQKWNSREEKELNMERQTNAVSVLTCNVLLKCQTEKSDHKQIRRRQAYRSKRRLSVGASIPIESLKLVIMVNAKVSGSW